MKEEISSQAITILQEGQDNHKQKIEKKRKIRKEKLQTNNLTFADLRSIDTSKLSRQDKAKIQKAKNRQAAQRSRDVHKEYVTNLEKQIKEMSQWLINSRKVCWRCQRQIQQSTMNDSHSTDQQIDQRDKDEHRCLNLQNISMNNMEEIHQINRNNHLQEQDSFLRASEHQDSYSYMKMILFICMVVAIACLSNMKTDSYSSRALMQLQKIDGSLQIQSQELTEVQSIKKISIENTNNTAVVKVEKNDYGLISVNSEDCLKSLMKTNDPSPDPKKSLTSYNDHTLNKNFLAHHEGILLCQVRMPKPNNQQINRMRSPLVRLYLLGSQIKQLITNFGLMVPILDPKIEMGGIYQVLAKIKEVSIVTNHNCLL